MRGRMGVDENTRILDAILPEGYLDGRVMCRHENRMVVRAAVPGGGSAVLKYLLPPFDARDAADFRSEYLLLDALAHPCWVRPGVFGGTPERGLFIGMEEAPGVPLSVHRLRGWKPETLEAARRILSGLTSLHHMGVAHLDLKPEQILLELEGQGSEWGRGSQPAGGAPLDLRILDLGLAAPFRTALKARGTPGFMAPELLRGETDWDGRADIYAVGAVLFDLFAGRAAFEGGDAAEILALQFSGEVPDPGSADGLPPGIRSMLREMLSPDPAGRPSTVLEVWQRLREQVPRDRVRELPARLTGPDTFAFLDREEEIDRFERFIHGRAGSGRSLLVVIEGAMGTGRRRFAARLVAVAQTSGWVPAESGTWMHFMRQGGGPGTLRIAASGEEDFEADERLILSLQRMSDGTCDALLQTRGIESSLLRKRLVDRSRGNPGLLFSAAAGLPPELEVIVPLTGADAVDRHLTESPPAYWVEWHRDLLNRLDPAEGDALIREALMISTEESGAGVCPAVLMADPERTRTLGHDLLGSVLVEASPSERAALSASLGFGGVLSDQLEAAMEELLIGQRHEDALRLFSKAHAVLEASSSGWTQKSLVDLAESAPLLGVRHGVLLPPPGDLEPLAANPRLPAAILLQAWSALARNNWTSADACLGRPEAGRCSPFVTAWLRFRRYRLSRDLPAARQALHDLGLNQGDDPARRFLVQSGRAEVLRHEGSLHEAGVVLRSLLEERTPVPEALRFAAVQMAANVVLNQGDMDGARELLQEALGLVDRSRLRMSRTTVLLGLGGLEYQAGNLAKSLQWCEGLLREWTRGQRWDQVVTALSNVGLLLLEQGRIGEAGDVLSWGNALAAEAGNHISRIRIERRTAQTAVWTGAYERAGDLARRLLEDPRTAQPERGHIMCIQGQALMDSGRPDEGRMAFSEGVRGLRESGAAEDAADSLGFWALSELDAGSVDAAAARAGEAKELMPEVSGVTRSIRMLVDGRLAVQAGEAPEKSLLTLDGAVSLLRGQNRWFFAWQAHWFRARAQVWLDNPAGAADDYGEARRILSAMAGSIGEESRVGPFLRRPATRQFLAEIGMA